MTTELTKAAQQDITERLRKDKWHITGVDAEEAAQLIEELREQLAKAKADERHIYEAYSRCADERSALTQRPAAQEVDYSDQLTKAKRLLVDLHKIGGDRVRSMIEARTGSWFIWGQDRSLPAPQQATPEPLAHTYASTQATNCAGCGEHKHTPLRIDAMGGYVCLTCIDNKLGSLLGEFGYPEPDDTRPAPCVPEGWRVFRTHDGIDVHTPDGSACYVEAKATADRRIPEEVLHALCSSLLAAAQAKGGEQ